MVGAKACDNAPPRLSQNHTFVISTPPVWIEPKAPMAPTPIPRRARPGLWPTHTKALSITGAARRVGGRECLPEAQRREQRQQHVPPEFVRLLGPDQTRPQEDILHGHVG